MQLLEPIRRAPGSAAAMNGLPALRRLLDDWPEFLAHRHGKCSHEHKVLSSFSYRSPPTDHELARKRAEGVRFELTRACALPVFKTSALNRSATRSEERRVGKE